MNELEVLKKILEVLTSLAEKLEVKLGYPDIKPKP